MTRLLATSIVLASLLSATPEVEAAPGKTSRKAYTNVPRGASVKQVRRQRVTVKPRANAFRNQYRLSEPLKSVFKATPAARKDSLAHGGWNIRKQVRRTIHGAKFSDHGKKHLKARNEADAKKFSNKAAQYMPGVNNAKLEKKALLKGLWIHRGNGALWSIYKFDKPVGYDGGKPTNWIRAEVSSGTFHGHPMSEQRVQKYIKGATLKK